MKTGIDGTRERNFYWSSQKALKCMEIVSSFADSIFFLSSNLLLAGWLDGMIDGTAA
jgi:hypothetical protein